MLQTNDSIAINQKCYDEEESNSQPDPGEPKLLARLRTLCFGAAAFRFRRRFHGKLWWTSRVS